MKYLIVIEKGETGYGAFSPDLPSCFATGSTQEECEARMVNCIDGYLAFLEESGQPIPAPTSTAASFVHVRTHPDGPEHHAA